MKIQMVQYKNLEFFIYFNLNCQISAKWRILIENFFLQK